MQFFFYEMILNILFEKLHKLSVMLKARGFLLTANLRREIILKNGIKTLAMWLIIGVIFIVVLSYIIENSDSKLKYSDLIANINSGNVEAIQIE